jgi:hypothetical protein
VHVREIAGRSWKGGTLLPSKNQWGAISGKMRKQQNIFGVCKSLRRLSRCAKASVVIEYWTTTSKPASSRKMRVSLQRSSPRCRRDSLGAHTAKTTKLLILHKVRHQYENTQAVIGSASQCALPSEHVMMSTKTKTSLCISRYAWAIHARPDTQDGSQPACKPYQ